MGHTMHEVPIIKSDIRLQVTRDVGDLTII